LRKKVEEIKEVLHFKNSIEHKILVTHVIAKSLLGFHPNFIYYFSYIG